MRDCVTLVILSLVCATSFLSAADGVSNSPPTSAEVSYGPHARNVLDFYQAEGDGARPLLVYIHGGGWVNGDKIQPQKNFQPYLDKGISYAAINYRLTPDNPLPAPVHDAARAIQFLRSKAKGWKIDTKHIALTGGSAGDCTSMWLLLHDDLADPNSTDPILRESTRVCAAAAIAGQTSIDPKVIEDWLGPNVLKHRMINMAVGEKTIEGALSNYDKYHDLYVEYSAYNHVDAQDPPLLMVYNLPTTLPSKDAGTVWLRSGASMSFRSVRWAPTGIIVLTQEGIKQFSFPEIGEIHLSKIDPWTSYYEQLSVLSPACESRLVQISTVDGSRWTTSMERFQSRALGEGKRPDQWFQLIQPAWCLESVWLRYRTIRDWRFHQPNEMPLSNVAPTSSSHAPVFGEGLDWQIDRNVQHGRLQSRDAEFGWGFGVHGTTELTFDFPETVRSFRTKFGLDRAANAGGCVNVEVTDGNGQSLFKHGNLVGAQSVVEMAWQDLPLMEGSHRRLSLRADMAHAGRPAEADPFDVRDLLNWYEPEVRLDQSQLIAEVAERRMSQIHGLMGWSLSPDDARSTIVANAVDQSDQGDPQFRLIMRPKDSEITLSRKIKVNPKDRWLAIVASRFADSSPSTIKIRIDGQNVGEGEIPIRESMAEPSPILVSIDPYQGRTVLIELIVHSTDDHSWIDWRGYATASERPGLKTVFEDDEGFANLLKSGDGQIELDSNERFSGKRSLKVTHGNRENGTLPGLQAMICEHPRLGQFRYLCFAWKKPTGTRIQFQLASSGRLGDLRNLPDVFDPQIAAQWRRTQTPDDRGRRFSYGYEEGVATTKPPIPLWMHGDLPHEWQLIQRDLFNDFGVFTVTGLSLNCVDGEAAWLDHVYLARTKQDLEYAATHLVKPPGERGMSIP